MDLDLVFLGTSGSVPTAKRGLAGTLLRRGGERILVDCGEGTQRQLLRSSVGLVELPEIFLTHYHADHYLGLPGMLKTFALRGREVPLTVYGPPGLNDLFGILRRVFGRLSYELTLVELQPGESVARADYRIETFAVEHGLSANGYAFVEEARPGRFDLEEAKRLGVPEGPLFGRLQGGEAVELPGRTTVNPEQVLGPARPGGRSSSPGTRGQPAPVLEAAKGADVLVHEATFAVEERERAEETLHATATSAAELALAAGVRLLGPHSPVEPLLRAGDRPRGAGRFPETVVPKDFDIIDVRFPERGGPRLVKGGALGRHEEGEPHGRGWFRRSWRATSRRRRRSRRSCAPRDPVGARVGRRDASDGAR